MAAAIAAVAAPTSVRVPRDKYTSELRGIAFADFATADDARKVLRALHGTAPAWAPGGLVAIYARDRTPHPAAAGAASDAVAAAQAMNATYGGWKPRGGEAAGGAGEAMAASWQPIDFESAAQAADTSGGSTESGFVFDAASGYYFDAASGYFWDPTSQLFYHPSTQQWYSQNAATGQYEAVPQAAGAAEAAAATTAAAFAPAATAPAVAAPVVAAPTAVAPTAVVAAQSQLSRSIAAATAAKPAAVAQDISTVDAWLQRKSAVVKKAAPKPAPVVVEATPEPVRQEPAQSMPPPVPRQPAGGPAGRIREKVYAVTAVTTPSGVQGKLYTGKYS